MYLIFKNGLNGLPARKFFCVSLFIVGVIFSASSAASDISKCLADRLPVQLNIARPMAFPFSDDSETGMVHDIKTSKADPYFQKFIASVVQHVSDKLRDSNICINDVENGTESLLLFVKWPIAVRENVDIDLASLSGDSLSGDCWISSPWMDMSFKKGSAPQVRGIFRWNERQMLADQATLAGMNNVQKGVLKPFISSDFVYFTSDYIDSEIVHSKKVPLPVIEGRIPSELVWLYQGMWQTTRTPFLMEALSITNRIGENRALAYTNLVNSLVDLCFVGNEVDVRYENILDVSDLVPLSEYKIDMTFR